MHEEYVYLAQTLRPYKLQVGSSPLSEIEFKTPPFLPRRVLWNKNSNGLLVLHMRLFDALLKKIGTDVLCPRHISCAHVLLGANCCSL